MRVLVRSICALSLCFPFVVSAANAAQDDWYTYRHDSQRTGAQPVASDLSDPARISGLHVVAQFPPDGSPAIPGGFKASPIVVNGMVFIGGDAGVWSCKHLLLLHIWQNSRGRDTRHNCF
jgi:hypothetical protein